MYDSYGNCPFAHRQGICLIDWPAVCYVMYTDKRKMCICMYPALMDCAVRSACTSSYVHAAAHSHIPLPCSFFFKQTFHLIKYSCDCRCPHIALNTHNPQHHPAF